MLDLNVVLIIVVLALVIHIVYDVTPSSLWYWYDARMDACVKCVYGLIYLRTPEQRRREDMRHRLWIEHMRRNPPVRK